MKRTTLVLVLAIAGLLTSLGAEAAPDDATINLARSYYEKGNAAYNLGRFDEAITWFTRAYETWGVPDFLYNIAQAYRLSGNCKQALFVYKRYLSAKEKDVDSPLSRKERTEVERFIKELTACAAKTDSTAQTPPAGLKTTLPTPATTTPPTTTTTTTTTTTPTTTTTTTTAKDPAAEGQHRELSSTASAEAKLLAVYASGGFAVLSAGGDLPIPMQSSFAIGVGHPLPFKPITLEVGAQLSYSPISYEYDVMGSTKNAALVGIRATVGAIHRVTRKISLRSDAGIGIALLSGLIDGNPFTTTREAGSFKMLSLRLDAAVDFDIAPNLVATVAPLGFGFSPMPSSAFISSLRQFDALVGFGYRM